MTSFNPNMARYLSFITQALAVVCLLANMLGWLIPESAELIARTITALTHETITLSTRALLGGWLISTFQLSVLAVGLWAMAKVFRLFAAGDYLHPAIGQYVQRFGKTLLLFGVLSPFLRTLLVLIITLDNPKGEQLLKITFISTDVVVVLIGALLIMLGLALKKAAVIAEENRQIV